MNIEQSADSTTAIRPGLILSLPSRWILSRLAATAEEMSIALDEYRFNDAANSIYQFVWHEFCDWYIEMAKIEFTDPNLAGGVRWCLVTTLDNLLKLLHPFMPYVTEELWQTIKPLKELITNQPENEESIMLAAYPKSLPRDAKAEEDMAYISDAITGLRTIRGELNILPSLKLNTAIRARSETVEKILKENIHYIKSLARADRIEIGMDVTKPQGSATSIKSSMEIFVPLKGILNITVEIDRLKKDKAKIDTVLVSLGKKLFNDDFLQRAPQEIVEKEKAKYDELLAVRDKITESIKILREAEVKDGS